MLLEQHDAKLRKYLSGPSWLDFWESPSFVDRETAQFLNGLRIPTVTGNPVLVLHSLGTDLVDSTFIDKLFTSGSRLLSSDTFCHLFLTLLIRLRLLLNTSGSGKTRLVFEGLCAYAALL